ncbi:MAG: pcrA 1 [Phycisphaerales bacterium]|nr:pcrA 1 [Phycisphaerales bacterium]
MIDAQELVADLTEPQREAVRHVDGPLLIIAGAGSGKTRVLTRRVAHLVSQGIPASSILAITFTNKAAGEMKQRIEKLLGRGIRDFGRLDQPWPTICTFHSLCLRILRHYAPQIGLANNFSIYDSSDQNKVIKDALKTLELSTTNFPPGTVHAKISNAKNQLISPADFTRSAGDFYSKTVARVYEKYQKLLAASNALDFDDLLLRAVQAFRDQPTVLKEMQERFSYILIDEYQDTNRAQYVLAHVLAQRHKNICVVGDPDQSIYAWRGADIRNIMEFEQDYPDAKVVRLEQNYRSTKTILSIASKLIAHNRQRKDKSLWTENDQGEKATLFLAGDEHDEAHAVTQRLKELKDKHGYSWNQVAVFYRMNSLSRVMEDALRKENVPYYIARGVEFYNRKEIKDVLAYLRVVANPSDEVSLERVANTPARGISDGTMKQFATYAVGNATSLWGALCDAEKISGLNARAIKACKGFVEQVIGWRRMAFDDGEEAAVAADMFTKSKGRVTKLMEAVVRQSGLEDFYKKAGGEEQDELGNINELISSAAEYDSGNPDGSVVDYLAQVSLVSDTDALRDNGGAVTMMTLHAAKGLEFPVVAMIGLEEGCLPHARARGNPEELEEERRLCFVGITRAQEKLIISKAAYRTIRGLRERTVASPFLNEMSQQDLQVIDRTGVESFSEGDEDGYIRQRMEAESERLGGQFKRGQLVRHKMFGLGRVAEITPMGSQTRAIIEFNTAGSKTLILEYAKLEAVG